MNRLPILIINDVWLREPFGQQPVATYFAGSQIVEAKIKLIIEEFRRRGYLIVHFGNAKHLWALDIKEGEGNIVKYEDLLPLITKAKRIFIVGFHTNVCISRLMKRLLDDFDHKTVILVEDATLNLGPAGETKQDINDEYIKQLIKETKNYIKVAGWETITTRSLLGTN